MLPELEAQQQLLAIEAAAVPHMKPEAAGRVMRRYVDRIRPRETKARSLHGALMQAGIRVIETPVEKR